MNFCKKIALFLFLALCLLAPSMSYAVNSSEGDRFSLTMETIWALGVDMSNATREQQDAYIQQYLDLIVKNYVNLMSPLEQYAYYLQQINSSPTTVDYDEIAKKLGLEPGKYSPEEIKKWLEDFKAIYDAEAARRASMIPPSTLADYVRYIMGAAATDGGWGSFCGGQSLVTYYNNQKLPMTSERFLGTEAPTCWNNLRDQISKVLPNPEEAPPADEPPVEEPPPAEEQPPVEEQPPEEEPTLPPEDVTPPPTPADPNAFAGKPKTPLDRLHEQLPAIINMLYAISYTLGIILVIASMLKFKQHSETSGSLYNQGNITRPIAFLLTGTALIFLPSALHSLTATFFADGGDSSLFSYAPIQSVRYSYEDRVTLVGDIIKVVGLISFIRGWLMLSKLGNEEHRGAMFKGIIYVFGGILAVNIMSVYTLMSKAMGKLF